MFDHLPEYELEELLEIHEEQIEPISPDKLSVEEQMQSAYVYAPVYVIKDAIERLKRYEIIVHNLTAAANFLWIENLKNQGVNKIYKSDTPIGSYKDETYRRMCMFVNRLNGEISTEDVFLEIVLAMSRVYTNDPTGLSQYLTIEDELFEQLETGETNG